MCVCVYLSLSVYKWLDVAGDKNLCVFICESLSISTCVCVYMHVGMCVIVL